jgi:hypothetical protein
MDVWVFCSTSLRTRSGKGIDRQHISSRRLNLGRMMDEDQPQNQPSIRGRSSGCTDRVVDFDLTVAPAENEEFDDMETGMSGYIFVEKSSQTPMEKEACGSQGVSQEQNRQPRESKGNAPEETRDLDMLKSQYQMNISTLRSAGHGSEDEGLHINGISGRKNDRRNKVLKVQVCI